MANERNIVFQPGMVLEDKWIIIEHIGKGAMGEVYRAHQKNLNRDVAIKTISNDVLTDLIEEPEEKETAIGRFKREVQTMAKVRHSNILTIYDYGEITIQDNGSDSLIAYIVMEYIPGNTLRFTLDPDGLDDMPEKYGEWISTYFLPILDGVQVLHDNKIVHRDLKPENIFLDGTIPKIADFGLARSHQMKAVTTSLEMLGTLAYMSPEQCSDFKNADFATDIYALGKMLFEAVHGTLTEKTVPFTSVTIKEADTPFLKAVAKIIEKATAELPENRYLSVLEVKTDLQNALELLGEDKSQTTEKKESQRQTGFLPTTLFGRLSAALIILVLSGAGMWGYHLLVAPQNEESLHESVYTNHTGKLENSQTIIVPEGEKLQETTLGRDGSHMILVGSKSEKQDNPLFYMDESPISNFLFVEFLNSIRTQVDVQEGIVRLNDTILIYLDDSSTDSGIIYKHNRFHLGNQNLGNQPVFRVTFHGAHLYAATYGRTLLSAIQYRFAFNHDGRGGEDAIGAPPDSEQLNSHDAGMSQMMSSDSSTVEQQVQLPSAKEDIREWVAITRHQNNDSPEHPTNQFEAGIMDSSLLMENKPPLKRFPWEGFENVGFRTALPVEIK